ncbi:MAG: hypothetical protein COA99_04540 [Moraxellaceae bacterium]|nr:MAG: hypothetical protein COA99_04540 [Moraxellaceae bacterium]
MILSVTVIVLSTLTVGCAEKIEPIAVTDSGLPLGMLCDGSTESFYDETIFERMDCGDPDAGLSLPKRRLESEPRIPSPYEASRCQLSLVLQAPEQRFECAETEFWHAYSDGRLAPRNSTLKYISEAIELSESVGDNTAEFVVKLSRLYQLRGMFYMALGIENGQWLYLVFSNLYAQKDFARVEELEPGNFVASSFDITLKIANAQVAGKHELALAYGLESLHVSLTAGDPDVIEPVNVGTAFAVTGVTMNYPLNTGLPQATLDAMLEIGCIDEVAFCSQNTLHAPFARPGLEYHLASIYARLGLRNEYIAQLEVVAEQDRYDDWAWKAMVEAQRADPDRLLEKYASYGDDQYSDSYAQMNNGCVMCHGRI